MGTLFGQEWDAFSMNETVMTWVDDNGMIDTDFVSNYRNGVCHFWDNLLNFENKNAFISPICALSLSVDTGEPTRSPLEMNGTYSPTTFPVESPTKSPTTSLDEMEEAWFITGVVFICLFGITLL